jgi:ribosome-binding factor A
MIFCRGGENLMAAHRIERINEEIRKELADILRQVKDPRIPSMTSILSVETTPDLKFCKVFVSFLDNVDKKESIKGLKKASGFIRHELSSRLNLRYTPQLNFEADESISRGVRISRMINELNEKSEVNE